MPPAPAAMPSIHAPGRGRPACFWAALVMAVAAAPGLAVAQAGDEGAFPAPLIIPELEALPLAPLEPSDGAGALSVPDPAGGPELKLQWLGEHYAVGPAGLQIDGSASGAQIGVNYQVQSALSIGALAQFDPAAEMLFGGQPSLSDHAWMAGPVTTLHLAPGLVLDARAAWGAAENGPEDLAGAGPAAQRRLVSARLAKAHAFGAWRFTPSLALSHLQETLHASPGQGASTGGGAAATYNSTGFGRIDLAPEVAYRIDMASATYIEPRAVLGSFWAFDDLADLTPGTGAHLEPRLKAEAGVTVGIVDGPTVQATGALEEGDGTAADTWSGRLQFTVPLR